MRKEVREFWKRNKTPIDLMKQRAPRHSAKPQQVEVAAQTVFSEVQEILDNVSDIKFHSSERAIAKLTLFHNHLRPKILGWRVFEIARLVKLNEETGKPVKKENKLVNWWKSISWRIDRWH